MGSHHAFVAFGSADKFHVSFQLRDSEVWREGNGLIDRKRARWETMGLKIIGSQRTPRLWRRFCILLQLGRNRPVSVGVS